MPSKILIFILFVGLVSSSFLFPQKAEAQFPVIDATAILQDVKQWIKDDLELALRDKAAKTIIDMVVRDTVSWIENGGSPRFITDWEGFLKNAGDRAIGDVLEETSLAFVCSPFKLQLQVALLPTQMYEKQITCSLTEAVDNIESFYDDFSNGGWLAYNKMWSPSGNFYGSYMIAMNEMSKRSAQATAAAQSEAIASGGFKSEKKCVEWDGDICVKEEIVTPGKTVGDAATNAVTADTNWAVNIQSWTSVLVNALINRLTTEGIGLAKSAVSDVTSGSESSAYTLSGLDNFESIDAYVNYLQSVSGGYETSTGTDSTYSGGTSVSFSKEGIVKAVANMESTLLLTAGDIYGRDVDLFFEITPDPGFEILSNKDQFEDVSDGYNLLLVLSVPELAYSGQYTLRAGAIPSNLVDSVKSQNGGRIPSVSTFPDLGFGIDEITLNVDRINYEGTAKLSVWQDNNTEGTEDNPFHSGEVKVQVNIIEKDDGFTPTYTSRWDYKKISGDYCNADNPLTRLQLFANASVGVPFSLLVPSVRTRVAVKVTGYVEDGIFLVSDTKTFYVDPSPEGCGY